MKGRTKMLAAILAAICLVMPTVAWAAESAAPPIWEAVVSWILTLMEDGTPLPSPDAAPNSDSEPEVSISYPPGG